MPYIHIPEHDECTSCAYMPQAKPTGRHPLGSVWMCPKCGKQYKKTENDVGDYGWTELTGNQKLRYDEIRGEWI